jgi:hypothetical protein
VWSSSDPSPDDHFAEHESCPYPVGEHGGKTDQESGLATTDTLGLSNGAPPNTSAAWTLTAPTGTTISAITYERYLGQLYDAVNDWVPALRADGTIITGETCLDTVENGETCYVGGPPGHGEAPATITGLSAHQLSYGLTCTAEPETECITGATQHAAWAAMYGAKVTISDPSTPTLSTPTGTLWENTTYHKGTQEVTVEAADQGGGIQSIQLSADGKPIETYTAPCDYTYLKPCPASTGRQTLSLPTTELTDGTHTVTLTTTDATGVQASTSQQIIVANEPPPPAIQVIAASSTGSDSYEVTWIDPRGQAIPITSATYEVCHPNDEPANCTAPATAGPEGPVTLVLPENGVWNFVVWLTNAAGNSSPNNARRLAIVVGPCCSTPAKQSEPTAKPTPTTTTSTLSTTPSITPVAPAPALSTPLPPSLHATATLRDRKLTIHITGASTATVRARYTLRYHGHHSTSKLLAATLRDGRATISFQLSKPLHSHATIQILIESASNHISLDLPDHH